MKTANKVLKNYTILYVEDNKEISEEIVFFLDALTKKTYVAYNGQEGLELYKEHKPDIIITDIQMPVMNGIEMIRSIRNNNSTTPIIITTAFNEANYLIEAINMGVEYYLMKPLNLKELLKNLHRIVEPLELKKNILSKNAELKEINENLDGLVKKKVKEIEYLYNHDPLTGIENFIRLNEELESGVYEHILLLDISNFSIINKQYGKIFSNKILKEVSNELKVNATETFKLFKSESDRFVFLSKETSLEKVEEFSRQIISYFDTEPINVDGVDIEISFSLGLAKVTDKYFPLVNAEYALETGKKLGSRYYYYYDESSEEIKKSKEMIKWLNITRELVQEDKIEPYYQPIVNLQTGEIDKYEVLARGNYKGEILSPLLFLGHAERLGLISSLTRIIVNKSFNYFSGTNCSFSINITQRDILDKQFIGFLESRLEKFAIDASKVTFEILENVNMVVQHKLLLQQLKSIKEMGFKIAIDDFGMDNSNFARLVEIDFDYIKLDGVFIKNLEINKKDRLIISAIVSLAQTLGVQTVAEFVENDAVYNLVKECGIDFAQGYYIGKPTADIKEILC